MNSNFDIVTQTQVGEWEKFQVVLVEHPLKQFIGQTIGLYNIDWFRFLRMRGSGAGEVDGSPESRTREVMPKDWYDCKFTVVNAGNNKAQPPMDPHPWPCRCSWGMGSTRSCHHENSLGLMIDWMVMISCSHWWKWMRLMIFWRCLKLLWFLVNVGENEWDENFKDEEHENEEDDKNENHFNLIILVIPIFPIFSLRSRFNPRLVALDPHGPSGPWVARCCSTGSSCSIPHHQHYRYFRHRHWFPPSPSSVYSCSWAVSVTTLVASCYVSYLPPLPQICSDLFTSCRAIYRIIGSTSQLHFQSNQSIIIFYSLKDCSGMQWYAVAVCGARWPSTTTSTVVSWSWKASLGPILPNALQTPTSFHSPQSTRLPKSMCWWPTQWIPMQCRPLPCHLHGPAPCLRSNHLAGEPRCESVRKCAKVPTDTKVTSLYWPAHFPGCDCDSWHIVIQDTY